MAYISLQQILGEWIWWYRSQRDKLQGLNVNQLKLEIHDTYKKMKK